MMTRNSRKAASSNSVAAWGRWMLLALVPAAGIAAGPASAATTTQERITIFAASSLTEPMIEIVRLWGAQGHLMPTLSFGSSGALAQEVAAGASADVFMSADAKWMDWLATRNLIQTGTRTTMIGNTLVLVRKAGASNAASDAATTSSATIGKGFDLKGVLGAKGRLAIGDPESVPAGIYARQALTGLGLWPTVAGRLTLADNGHAAAALVEQGEAPAAIIYGTDARMARGLGVAGTFPESSHDPIRYPVAVLAKSDESAFAASFVTFLGTQAAQAVFRKDGFVTLGQ